MAKRVAVAVLAAGQSRRFGEADKLCAWFRGRMLGEYVTSAIPREHFEQAWVIASSADHPCADSWRAAGFKVQSNPNAGLGMGSSVALAAQLAQDAKADGLLIALADMPLVPAQHFLALAQALRAPAEIYTSALGDARMPPAIFGADHLSRLAQASGDKGARDILSAGNVIASPPEWLTDIDTPETLAALN